MPYRAYAELSDADASAIVAYLRTLPPVKSQVPPRQLNFPVSLFIKLAPRPLEGPVPEPNREDPVAYGRYLSGGCEHCHSPVNGRGQKLAGREFSGGQEFKFSWGGSVVSANLTPDPTGLGSWTKDQFIARFRGYAEAAQHPVPVAKEHNTVMPWLSLSTLTDEDLGALYAFLRTLPPIDNRVVTFPMPPAQ
jgi:mono/diheme cytochrome c family protein